MTRSEVSLLIGVTGHRDVDPSDAAALRAAFGRTVADLQRSMPATPFAVLCGMASGADTLAAEEAFARGLPVIACLPAAIERYELDFPEAERQPLRARLERCAEVVTLPDSADSDGGYLELRNYLLRFSHLLVAFWDGVDTARPGGTSDVVRARLTGTHLALHEAHFAPVVPDVGPVVQIVTPRAGAARPSDAFTTVAHYPVRRRGDDRSKADFDEALRQFDAYNSELGRQCAETPADPSLASLQMWTDLAANRLQRITLRYLNLLYFLGWCVAVVSVLSNEVTRLATILLAYAAYIVADRSKSQTRYQDYRAIGEALRVQQAWVSVGLSDALVDNAYLRMQQSELMWIRMVLRSVALVFCQLAEGQGSQSAPSYRQWVEGQVEFFGKAARREDGMQRGLNRSGIVATIAGTVIGGVLLGFANLGSLVAPGPLGPFHEFLGLLATSAAGSFASAHRSSLIVCGTAALTLGGVYFALVSSYAERRSFQTNAKRYERMLLLFDDARERLDEIDRGRPGHTKRIIFEVGREALVEHADWLLARRDRPLVLVQGG